jgi:hypothetical protein
MSSKRKQVTATVSCAAKSCVDFPRAITRLLLLNLKMYRRRVQKRLDVAGGALAGIIKLWRLPDSTKRLYVQPVFVSHEQSFYWLHAGDPVAH